MGKNPSAFGPNGGFKEKVRGKDTADHPVESVRWIEAIELLQPAERTATD